MTSDNGPFLWVRNPGRAKDLTFVFRRQRSQTRKKDPSLPAAQPAQECAAVSGVAATGEGGRKDGAAEGSNRAMGRERVPTLQDPMARPGPQIPACLARVRAVRGGARRRIKLIKLINRLGFGFVFVLCNGCVHLACTGASVQSWAVRPD